MSDKPARFHAKARVLSALLVLGLIVVGAYLLWQRGSREGSVTGETEASLLSAEAPDTADTKEYSYSPSELLPVVKGPSQYRWNPEDKTVRFSYNVWAGWLPVIAANRGTRPNPDSIFYRKYGFKVDMVLMDNPVAARNAFAKGEVHTLWGTVDMMVLIAPRLFRDSRTAPRIVQQIDWSSGGDGIVAKPSIQAIGGLRGKTVALAKNSPSEYFLHTILLAAGLQPNDVTMRYTATAFEAAAALRSDEGVDACVSWAPDIYRIAEIVKDARILASTSDLPRLIADVYAVRADFVRDHPDIVDGLIAGIFEGMDYIRESPEHGVRWMADAFFMKPEEVMEMRRDTVATNFADNLQFFLDTSNPANFEHTWKNVSSIYGELGRLGDSIAFDWVVDFSFLKKLKRKGTFAHQERESLVSFIPANLRKMRSESPILTRAVRISFPSNSADPFELARDTTGKLQAGEFYDPNVGATMEYIAGLSEQLPGAAILIEGHADSSMKERKALQAANELSMARAEAVQRILVEKYKLDPNRITLEARGWTAPADPDDPHNHALNRRVEISLFPTDQ